MRVTGVIALIAAGAIVFMGLGALLHIVSVQDRYSEASMTFMALFGGAGLILFISGIFFGYLYGKPARQNPFNKGVIDRFRNALDFERRQRTRLERELYEAKTAMTGIEDELARAHQALEERDVVSQMSAQGAAPAEDFAKLAESAEKLKADLLRRKERIADLQAELSIAQAEVERARQETETTPASQPPAGAALQLHGKTVKDALETLVGLDGVHVALVADDFGLVVDCVGTTLPPEGVAAVSSVFSRTGQSIRDVLPQIQALEAFSVRDERGLVLDTHFFDLFETRCAIAVARDASTPYVNLATQAADTIIEKLSE